MAEKVADTMHPLAKNPNWKGRRGPVVLVIMDGVGKTDKDLGGQMLHIVLFADSHLGITLDGDSFAREMERIQAEQPDVVFLAGDFVDDDSCKADMLAACEALGRLQTKYGVYFIYGNHDNGYFQYRDFTSAELRQARTRYIIRCKGCGGESRYVRKGKAVELMLRGRGKLLRCKKCGGNSFILLV